MKILNAVVFLGLLALGAVFILVEQPLPAGLCWIAAIAVAITKAWHGTAKAGNELGKTLSAGVREEAEKAEGSTPDESVFVEGIRNAGDIVGQQAFSPDRKRFKYKGHGASASAAGRLMAYFNKLFK
ncbi:MAG: hypothetical protein NTW59_03420 [Candidatus Diapherotrites archaeon]|nr:hypothetical protein [Candidatus Diapherotrites archaeon]